MRDSGTSFAYWRLTDVDDAGRFREGQRRNPVWGECAPASFSSETTQGFTGHESDDELGLVNMKGRIYGAPVKTGRRKQVRTEEMETQILTIQVLPWEGAAPQEAESCAGRGDPAGEA
ncbi:uncharacterized protein SOCE26_106710 [Sorangium cellulosum]|uniref:Uncharacterized protein n=1 Tax=Sorangium cellulosum TaxID=56 RepID=A0A2L0FBZ2_SORCE|nr:hypothetical protein [Sorangium cellulosum]AUX49126.1 uncharacterized protein SOCE26_106710 [Sorangium cellulosum]